MVVNFIDLFKKKHDMISINNSCYMLPTIVNIKGWYNFLFAEVIQRS
jgi:hypothetical protein